MAYDLSDLFYPYNALEPHIDARTMEIHHTKHHQTYVAKLNSAIKSASYEAPKTVEALIAQLDRPDVDNPVPDTIRTAVRNNGGGHANHSFFWGILTPEGGGEPREGSPLAEAINKDLGGFIAFKKAFAEACLNRFGSGWAWLVVKSDGSLAVTSTPNQDSPLMSALADISGTPVIGLDIWEHAYYLKYQNRRADYIDAFWNIVNWEQAETNYAAVKR